ncbi:MAG: hypothetical protein DRI01_05600 [Chloroflexi bacterium]|nr:MAG: hypothetical protein DRI01_05600 [Chloroflexota bacterium]
MDLKVTTNAGRASTRPKKRVLAVDADPEVIQILEVNLTFSNLEVISAGNGAEALLKASAERPDIIILDAVLPDMDSAEICQQLKGSSQTSHIPLIIIGIESLSRETKAKVIDLADHCLKKPFDPKEAVSLVKAYLTKMERAENISKLTGLPNQTQIYNEITSLIEQNRTFAAIYVDMDDLRGFNKAYGFNRGDRAIRLLSDVLSEAVRLFGNPDDLVGHLGGDNFVVVSTVPKARILCRRIITDFDNQIRTLYDQKDLERGYIEYAGRLGQKEQSPIMDLRVAVVTNERHAFHHYLEVSETAAEQIEYLRRFPGSNCYFDLRESGVEPELHLINKNVLPVRRQELKALQGVLAWLTFLIREIDIPITSINDCVSWLESESKQDFTPRQLSNLKAIRESADRLLGFLREITDLAGGEWTRGSPVIGEANIDRIFDWILGQLDESVKKRKIKIKIAGVENIGQLLLDGKALTEGLFYILQSLIKISHSGDRLYIQASDDNEGNIIIEMVNPNRFIPHQKISQMYQAQLAGALPADQSNKFYVARVLLQSLGSKVNIDSDKENGLSVTIVLPKRWKSSINDVNALLYAADISRNEAKNQLDTLSHILSSYDSQIQTAVSEPLKNVGNKIQELLVLCNRSLFLANELTSQLEMQQDRLLQQEVEQFATTETLLTICQEMAKLLGIGHLFSRESSQRVEQYANIIANEFKLSSKDRQALLYAALLKDLGLVSSVEDMLEQGVALSREQATTIKEHFSLVWKSVSKVGFLSRALVFILHRYERYDGKGYLLGVRGINIPLGAKVLAVADTFDSMTTGLSPLGKLSSRVAAQKIAEDSGQRFEPDVVSAFLRVWRRGEFRITRVSPKIIDQYEKGKTSLNFKKRTS